MAKKLFCELNPLTYKISVTKGILRRKLKWFRNRHIYANTYETRRLPIKIYEHKSLIRRQLGNVDMVLQENKATNLGLAAPRINGIIIKPQEVFSFWRLLGKCTKSRGYREGLVIRSGNTDKGVGGGMCQFTNLIHWMILHSSLTIIEHHHHNQIDIFPDYGRQVPFGTGTSIMYNYLDYQFVNNTDQTFQLITYASNEYLCGELRSEKSLEHSYHIVEQNSYFTQKKDGYYRNNEIYKKEINNRTGNLINKTLVTENHSKVLYDEQYIPIDMIRAN
ncbi:VanW family protein [Vallitalea sediminicola]